MIPLFNVTALCSIHAQARTVKQWQEQTLSALPPCSCAGCVAYVTRRKITLYKCQANNWLVWWGSKDNKQNLQSRDEEFWIIHELGTLWRTLPRKYRTWQLLISQKQMVHISSDFTHKLNLFAFKSQFSVPVKPFLLLSAMTWMKSDIQNRNEVACTTYHTWNIHAFSCTFTQQSCILCLVGQ